jgi:hypothetical protein
VQTAAVIRFPKTPRLAEVVVGDVHRAWRSLATVVEEKVDGANVGIFFDDGALRIQSRGHILRGGDREAQFGPLHAWAAERLARLRDGLGNERVLYGEWCFAKHRVYYDALPDWFVAFDVLDRPGKAFLTTPDRDALFASMGIHRAPRLWSGSFGRAPGFATLLGPSRFKTAQWRSVLDEEAARVGARDVMAGTDPSNAMEGVYVRVEDAAGVAARMKLIRDGFEKLRNDDWGRRLVRNRRSLRDRPGFQKR